MLGNAAPREIRAPVVNHLFPRLCVNNLVQSRAINKIAREISSTSSASSSYQRSVKWMPRENSLDKVCHLSGSDNKNRGKFFAKSEGNRPAESSTDDGKFDFFFFFPFFLSLSPLSRGERFLLVWDTHTLKFQPVKLQYSILANFDHVGILEGDLFHRERVQHVIDHYEFLLDLGLPIFFPCYSWECKEERGNVKSVGIRTLPILLNLMLIMIFRVQFLIVTGFCSSSYLRFRRTWTPCLVLRNRFPTKSNNQISLPFSLERTYFSFWRRGQCESTALISINGRSHSSVSSLICLSLMNRDGQSGFLEGWSRGTYSNSDTYGVRVALILP